VNKANQALLDTVERGYRVSRDGVVYGLHKSVLKLVCNSEGYLIFSGAAPRLGEVGKSRYAILVHRFVAYHKFGDALFDAECVRHLDNNKQNNSWDNIAVGTQKENLADLSPEYRSDSARKSWAKRRSLTADQVRSIRYWYSKIHPGTGVKLTQQALADIYDTTQSQIHLVVRRKTYRDVA